MSRLRSSLPARRNMNEFAMRCTPNEPAAFACNRDQWRRRRANTSSRDRDIYVHASNFAILKNVKKLKSSRIINVNYRFALKTINIFSEK